ncbi:uncharacterized protein N7515_004611 [Penicillium bovifimosum]|uniref:Uncharacterized protein n=1 Tax=Penicillium bovifimosum TaxID=126998 RepID=A0A9W9L3H8_9EURO|nr:uncharacterized protein N7515_004611 [Penicillium bovifimosum]KAJ5135333.1 hypothetical protein N7515_004611 [Penicillium bovifimosum]
MYSHLEAAGNVLTNPHCQAQTLPVGSQSPIPHKGHIFRKEKIDRLLEPQIIVNFVQFAFGSALPNGKQPTVEYLKAEEISLFDQQQNFPPGTYGESIINRVMGRIGSDEDFTRLCQIGKNLQFLKSRLFSGIIPLSEQLWQEKGLDQRNNFDAACQHLSSVLGVFQYLNAREVRLHLRDTFNHIYDIWALLDTVLNESRAAKNEPLVSIAGLWTIYMTAHFEMMTERAHRWVIVHVNALRAPLMQTLRQHRPTDGGNRPDALQWQITNSLQVLAETAACADFTICIPMNDYKGYTLRRTGSDLHAADLDTRAKAYHRRLKLVTREFLYRNVLEGNTSADSEGESYYQTSMSQVHAQDQLRREMRGAPIEPVPCEPWISSFASRIESGVEEGTETGIEERQERAEEKAEVKYGFVVYRLTYGQTDSEWDNFVRKLEAHVSDWGKGQTGSGAIKEHLKLHWLDGKELNIAEGDIVAAKHLTNASESGDWSDIEDGVFLVVDAASFASYTTDSYGPATSLLNPGDFTGFLLAVDGSFDPVEGIERPDESPGYSGQMRILGSLIWGDLYSLLSSQTARLEDIWPLAIEHPNLVYVGPTIPLQRLAWREHNDTRWPLVRAVVDYVKGKLGQ